MTDLIYRPRFEGLYADLMARPDIDVLRYNLPSGIDRSLLAQLQEQFNDTVPADVAEFYSEMNGFELQWRLVDSPDHSQPVSGSIDILPLQEVLQSWRGVTWDGRWQDFRSVQILDFFIEEACAALILSPVHRLQPSLHYHYLGRSLYDTGYTFSEYIDRVLMARGFFYWIESLCRETEDSTQTHHFLETMPKLFPGFDPTLFKHKP